MSNTLTQEFLTQYLIDFTLPKNFTSENYHALLRILINCQLHGYVAHKKIDDTDYPLPFKRHLASVTTFARAQQLQVLHSCKILSNDLRGLGQPLLLLKGAAYIVAKKSHAQGRLISDIDILVAKEYLPKVEALL
jgi:hypothetical protein